MNILPFIKEKSKRKKQIITFLLLFVFLSRVFLCAAFADEEVSPESVPASADQETEATDAEAEEDDEEQTEDVTEEATETRREGAGTARTLGGVLAPPITAEGAILMDADNMAILYQKNMDQPYFPASITKIMTCLLAVEKCPLSDVVTMSNEAVFGIDRTSSNVGLDVGQKITMEEAILCVMLASANEAASAIAEHVSGSIEDFVDLMNERAKELGCTNTHFHNANGLPDDEHYISPHDMAIIAKAFNDNETCRRLASLRDYDIEPTSTQPDEIHLLNHHKMYDGLTFAYDPVVWGKTGYTMAAGATLVTVAEKDGMSLICVVMKDESDVNYTDTRILFDFGFSNYSRYTISEYDTNYNMDEAPFFQIDDTTFGSTKSFVYTDKTSYVVLPTGISFSKLDSRIEYRDDTMGDEFADVVYELNGDYAGECHLMMEETPSEKASFSTVITDTAADKGVTFINVKKVIPYVVLTIVVIGFIVLVIHVVKTYNFGNAMNKRMDIRRRRKRYHSDFDDIDF